MEKWADFFSKTQFFIQKLYNFLKKPFFLLQKKMVFHEKKQKVCKKRQNGNPGSLRNNSSPSHKRYKYDSPRYTLKDG